MKALWLIATLFIVYGTTIPFEFTTDRAVAVRNLSKVTLNPLVSSATGGRASIPDVVQNVLLFVPFGLFGLLARGATGRSVLVVTGLAAALSLGVEVLQLFMLNRTASVGDVVLDTTGALVGAVIALRGRQVWMDALRRVPALTRGGAGAVYPTLVAGLVLCVAAWEPFDVTLDVSTAVMKVRALQQDLWQFTGLRDEGVAVVQYALFTFAAAAWLSKGVGSPPVENSGDATSTMSPEFSAGGDLTPFVMRAACIGIAAAFVLEASQIAMSSRMPGLSDAAVRALGAVAGVLAWSVFSRNPHRRPVPWLLLLIAATAAGAAMQALLPFAIAPIYHHAGWLPFWNYYERTTFEMGSHALELMLTYFPLGFCFALVLAGTGRAIVTGALVALAIAAPIELAQGWIVGHHPDITDAGLGVAGAALGAWTRARGGSAFRDAAARQFARHPPANYNGRSS